MNARHNYRTGRRNLILERYEQLGERGQVVGEGASGIVVKARDAVGSYGEVALKRPNPMLSLVERRKKSAQIRRESEALKQLTHQAACRYVEDGKWPRSDDHYLVTAWAEGQQIEDRLRQLERSGKSFPLGEALELLGQLADLLVYAHAEGVVHNDLDAKHLYWDTASTEARLTVIDWANCALSTDARPIAGAADDINQYGELMHRLLTGSTVAYASRLGGDGNWRVELVEKDVPEILQHIVGRAIGRDSLGPYESMVLLYDDLQAYKKEYESPIRKKITRIEILLEKNTLDSLNEAEVLLNEVAFWNPMLVTYHQQQLQHLRRQRAETTARIGGKTSLLAEHWAVARDEIIDIFGDDVRDMPQMEERYIFLCGDLMDSLQPEGEQYDLGKEVVEQLFGQTPRDENVALDKVLLLYGPHIPNNVLIEELSNQTGRRFPLRNRIRQQIN